METLEGIVFEKPFPHLIINNFYNEDELQLIWEELKFYTKPDKFFEAKDFGGVIDKTNSHAIILDQIYKKNRKLSNILTVNRKLFTSDALDIFAEIEDCCCIANKSNYDITKVRYYHDQEYYKPHTDKSFQFLAFSYFYKQPKKFSGGDLLFPKYNYQYPCNNNSIIIFPGWVEHGVSKITINDSDYYDGYGRYSITSFFGCKSN
tara:strand:+ start:24 stop:638 length:615 start_codon:yes stop_codon:yes gene_type:complete